MSSAIIKAEHTLYLTMSELIGNLAQIANANLPLGLGGLLNLVMDPAIRLPLLAWSRRAELTADRYALLCADDDIDVCLRV